MSKVNLEELIKKKLQDDDIDLNFLSLKLGISKLKLSNKISRNQIDVELLLKISILLKYDFFRHFSFYLMLHHAISTTKRNQTKKDFLTIRKNIYTQEIKEFIVNQIATNVISIKHAIEKYGIPKTTLYKWLKQINSNISNEEDKLS